MASRPVFYRFMFLRLDSGEIWERDYFWTITAVKEKAILHADTTGLATFADWSADNYRIILWSVGEVFEPQ